MTTVDITSVITYKAAGCVCLDGLAVTVSLTVWPGTTLWDITAAMQMDKGNV